MKSQIRLRRPEFTGENRCWPCTVLNVCILAVAAGAVFVLDPLLATGLFAVGAAAIFLRGYVIPGTPRFGPTVARVLPFDFEDAQPGLGSDSLAGETDPEFVLRTLVEEGVVAVDGEDLVLAQPFQEAWVEQMALLRECSLQTLADRVAAAAGGTVETQVHDDRILVAGERDVWLRRAVAIAETAAIETLADQDFPADSRVTVAGALRMFVPACPGCGGTVEETTVRNCCGGTGSVHSSPDQPVLACRECETVLFEFRE